MIHLWFAAFVMTCAVELVVVRVLARGRVPVVLGAQLATHPAVWIAVGVIPLPLLARVAIVEVGATLVEAAIYRRFLGLPRLDALAVSCLANAASLGFGAFLSTLW